MDVFQDLEEMDTLALQDSQTTHPQTRKDQNEAMEAKNDDVENQTFGGSGHGLHEEEDHQKPLTLAFNLTPDSNGELHIDGPIEEIDSKLGKIFVILTALISFAQV